MPTVTKLGLYNEALRIIGERSLASVTENREPRRALDSVWDAGGVQYCLEAGLWKFALRTVELSYSPSIDPSFGYQHGFTKPDDFVRTAAVCEDAYFLRPLLQYSDEAGFWFSDLETIYVRYVSNDPAYGNDTSLWPQTFFKFVAAHFAAEIAMPITQNIGKEDRARKLTMVRLKDALSKDAMSDPTKFMPQGSWVSARRGNGFNRNDRGDR